MQNIKGLTQLIAPYFFENGLKINYKKGQQFFRPEDMAQGIYYLKSGQAALYSTKTGGWEQILALGEEGTIFGKIGSVISQPSVMVSAQAITDSVVYRLNCEQFNTLISTELTAFKAYMNQVSRNNIWLVAQALILGEKDIYLRVISELLLLVEFHGDIYDDQACCLRVSLTQSQLASMVCISREYLSKTLKKIKLKKLIEILSDGRIKIPNLAVLKNEVEKD